MLLQRSIVGVSVTNLSDSLHTRGASIPRNSRTHSQYTKIRNQVELLVARLNGFRPDAMRRRKILLAHHGGV